MSDEVPALTVPAGGALTGEIPVAHIAMKPRADVVVVRRVPEVPSPVAAAEHVALMSTPARHSVLFYVGRAIARSAMWLLFAAATIAGIWASTWLAYLLWVIR